MVLADTSIWIEHFRRGRADLAALLSDGRVLMHPCILGEVACGNLKNRLSVLSSMNALPMARHATSAEVLRLIEERKLWGRGIGWVDAQLLASALLSHCRLWTLDKHLAQMADDLGLS